MSEESESPACHTAAVAPPPPPHEVQKEQEEEEHHPKNNTVEEPTSKEHPNEELEEEATSIPQHQEEEEEEKPRTDEEKPREEEQKDGATVTKSASFKDESNLLWDHEKRALLEFRSMLEEAILSNKLLRKNVGDVDQSSSETKEATDPNTGTTQADISLWGVPLQPSKGSENTDVVLLKFLRAREFKAREALEMLSNTLRWRVEMNLDGILVEEGLGEGLEGAGYMDSGRTKAGLSICYNVYGVFQDEETYQRAFGTAEREERFMRWRIQLMERGIMESLDLSPRGITTILQVTDLRNAPGVGKKELRHAMKRAVSLLQDNYPEFVAKNLFINVPFWYYAFNAILSPFLTQRTKSKFVFARPSKVTETLLRYIPAAEIPLRYGGLRRDNDPEFSPEDGGIFDLVVKAGTTENIELPAPQLGMTLLWDISVVGWDVYYKEEFVPDDEGSYTLIVQKGRRVPVGEEALRNSFRVDREPGKVVLTVENTSFKKRKVLYRYKTKSP